MKHSLAIFAALLALAGTSASAATQQVDLSGATSGTTIVAPGASFAQTFAGQSVVAGNRISGSPTGPLTLAPAGTITVGFFSPGVSAASNSLLSQPGNAGPLSILFDTLADNVTFTMGSSDAGSTVDARAFDISGNLTGSTTITMGSGYNIYNLAGLGTFKGLTFLNNNDNSGVRFQNFSFNSVAGGGGAVPEPATWAMMLTGFGAMGVYLRRRRRATSLIQAA